MNTKITKQNKGKKRRKLTAEQKFQRAWQRVLKAKQNNEKIKRDVEVFADKIRQQIESIEISYTTAFYSNTEQLIGFLSRKSLPQWQRYELYQWIGDNLNILTYHPFVDHLDIPALLDRFREMMPEQMMEEDAFIPDEDPVDSKTPDDPDSDESSQEEKGGTMDMFEELFDDADLNKKNEDITEEEDLFEQFYEEIFEEQQAYEDERKKEIQALDQVLKASSMNKMFRKIAARLHPDREQDPDKKAQKHQQMSALVDARDKRDVLTLFALYEQHVGEPFDQLIDTDHQHLTTLLEHQLMLLEEEREQLIDEIPKSGMIYRRFHKPTKAKVSAHVRSHIKDLEGKIDTLETFASHVTSLKKLKPYLEERYDMNQNFLANMIDNPFFVVD